MATYQTKEGGEAEEEDVEIIKADMDSTDPAYWEKLLRYSVPSFITHSTSATFICCTKTRNTTSIKRSSTIQRANIEISIIQI